MAATYFPNLMLTNAQSNVVDPSIVNGTFSNGSTWTGTITQVASKTATLGSTSFLASSNVNFLNSTIQNATISLVNSNSVEAAVIASGNLGNGVVQTGNIVQVATKTATLGGTNFLSSSNVDFTNGVIKNASITSANSNSVDPAAISSGSLGNGVIHTGNITQVATKTATLGSTSFLTSSTADFTNASVTHAALTGANFCSVDNAALPTTITQTINNTTSVTSTSLVGTTLTYGNTTTGTGRVCQSKNYATALASNITGTVCTLTLVFATTSAWSLDLMVKGTTTTTGYIAVAEWVLSKGLGVNTISTYAKSNYVSGANIAVPTVAWNNTTGVLTITQVAGTATDGNVIWNISTEYVGIVGTPATPVYS